MRLGVGAALRVLTGVAATGVAAEGADAALPRRDLAAGVRAAGAVLAAAGAATVVVIGVVVVLRVAGRALASGVGAAFTAAKGSAGAAVSSAALRVFEVAAAVTL